MRISIRRTILAAAATLGFSAVDGAALSVDKKYELANVLALHMDRPCLGILRAKNRENKALLVCSLANDWHQVILDSDLKRSSSFQLGIIDGGAHLLYMPGMQGASDLGKLESNGTIVTDDELDAVNRTVTIQLRGIELRRYFRAFEKNKSPLPESNWGG